MTKTGRATDAGDSRMEELVASFLSYLSGVRRLSDHTVRAYRTDLEAFSRWCSEQGVDPLHMSLRWHRRYLASMVQAGYADKTVNRRTSSLRTFFKWVEREQGTSESPVFALSGRKLAKRLPKTVEDEEATRLIDTCEGSSPEALRDRAFLELLYATGARISEAARLKPADVDLNQGQVRLFGKGSKERIVPLYPSAIRAIDDYLEHGRPELQRKGKGPGRATKLFLSTRGNDMSADALRVCFERHVAAAGLDAGITPHAMRHSFATELLTGGADLKVVQELLGHESLATTQIYTHLSIDRLKSVTKQAHPRS